MATKLEQITREILEPEPVGIKINGKNPWDIQVYDDRFCEPPQSKLWGILALRVIFKFFYLVMLT